MCARASTATRWDRPDPWAPWNRTNRGRWEIHPAPTPQDRSARRRCCQSCPAGSIRARRPRVRSETYRRESRRQTLPRCRRRRSCRRSSLTSYARLRRPPRRPRTPTAPRRFPRRAGSPPPSELVSSGDGNSPEVRLTVPGCTLLLITSEKFGSERGLDGAVFEKRCVLRVRQRVAGPLTHAIREETRGRVFRGWQLRRGAATIVLDPVALIGAHLRREKRRELRLHRCGIGGRERHSTDQRAMIFGPPAREVLER